MTPGSVNRVNKAVERMWFDRYGVFLVKTMLASEKVWAFFKSAYNLVRAYFKRLKNACMTPVSDVAMLKPRLDFVIKLLKYINER